MSVGPGETLLHYRIVDKLGEGGMGVVWRAEDTSLERQVAIKVLPDALSADPERLARFEREARLLASLNHPNIATIHGLHETAGARFLAMELVEGEDLATCLDRGPLPPAEALEIARRIAQGVGAAHASGVIHRDLKPANVRIASGGQVKVLDFGLAKAFDANAPSGDPSSSPTLTSAGTMAGVILGTAAYMSPEQARGHEADKRADVWAFGCLLYEMLTGRRAFAGDTISDTLASVLKDQPDLDAVPDDTPRAVRRVLARCLTKDPDRRIHDIVDARLDLESAGDEPQTSAAEPSVQRSHRGPPALLALVALLATGAALGLWLTRPRPSTPEVRRFSMELDHANQYMQRLAISPDGKRLIYVGDEPFRLLSRPLDRLESSPIPGGENARVPFFSPEGKWMGFAREGKLRKMSVAGGPMVTLCPYDGWVYGADWNTDGTIYFSTLDKPRNRGTVLRIPETGGTPQTVFQVTDEEREFDFAWPALLPGGRSLLFTRASLGPNLDVSQARIELLDLDTLERSVVLEGAIYGQYAASGHVVGVGHGGNMMAVPFDPSRGVATGGVVTLEARVRLNFGWWPAMTSSPDGMLIYIEGVDQREGVLSWLDADGSTTPISNRWREYVGARVSPDGQRIAVEFKTENRGAIQVLDPELGSEIPLCPRDASCSSPIWTPNGKQVLYAESRSDEENRGHIVMRRADGSTEPRTVMSAPEQPVPKSVSPNGKTLIFSRRSAESGGLDLWTIALDGGEPQRLLATEGDDNQATFSPDGRWIAYESHNTTSKEIYLRPRSDLGSDTPVSNDDGHGHQPQWNRKGTALFYQSHDPARVMRVSVDGRGRIGAPQQVVVLDPDRDDNVRLLGVAPDGRVLVMNRPGDEDKSRTVVVLDWFDELQRLAPAR